MRSASVRRRWRTFSTSTHTSPAQSGHGRAGAYIARIEAVCRDLGAFPERGTRRDDLRPGLRTLGFQRQASILFRVDADGVEIGRILYGGRDLAAMAIALDD